MAMIRIVKGEKEMTIPAGAFKMYASVGWSKVENPDTHDDKDKNTQPPAEDSDLLENPEQDEDDASEELDNSDESDENSEEDDSEEEDDDVEYVDPEELLQKPLGELDFEELQIVAEYLGINTEKLTSGKALRKAIKDAQK